MTRGVPASLWREVVPTLLLVAGTAVVMVILNKPGRPPEAAAVVGTPAADAQLCDDVARQAAAISRRWQDVRVQEFDASRLVPPPVTVDLPPQQPVAVAAVSNVLASTTSVPPESVYCMSGVMRSEGKAFVRLNDRFYAEGAFVAPGVYVKEIGANHAVLVDTQRMRRVVIQLYPSR